MKRSLLAGLGAVAFTAALGLAPTALAEARTRGVSADAIADAAPAAYTRYRGYRRHAVYGRRGYPTATATIAETMPARRSPAPLSG